MHVVVKREADQSFGDLPRSTNRFDRFDSVSNDGFGNGGLDGKSGKAIDEGGDGGEKKTAMATDGIEISVVVKAAAVVSINW